MIVGIPPFNDNTPSLVFERIENRDIMEWDYLKTILDKVTVSLIDDLLQLDPKKRPTLQQIKRHKFFQGFDFNII